MHQDHSIFGLGPSHQDLPLDRYQLMQYLFQDMQFLQDLHQDQIVKALHLDLTLYLLASDLNLHLSLLSETSMNGLRRT